jgi:hypothetical protein
MTKKNYPCLPIQQVAACALPLIMTLGAYAQDVRDDPDLMAPLGLERISYDPPTEDVFVVDSGPGLDTGCTYNDDPEHPLIIDIPIDHYVGEVNEEGYLKNPESLIAKGVVPATVKVAMPAYDIDVDGRPPSERDEVLLNGEHVYTLTGYNEVWEYNFFSVDIRKIKFPAAPSQVAINQVQINVDVLSDERWCAAIDWVALHIKIRPNIALSLTPMGHNQIRVNDRNSDATFDMIYEDSFEGADCGTPKEEDKDKYPSPFSAQMGRDVILAIKLESCSEDAPPSSKVVKFTWKIGGA